MQREQMEELSKITGIDLQKLESYTEDDLWDLWDRANDYDYEDYVLCEMRPFIGW